MFTICYILYLFRESTEDLNVERLNIAHVINKDQSKVLHSLIVRKPTNLTSARVAQWIRRRSPKPKIGGSSPPVGKNTF